MRLLLQHAREIVQVCANGESCLRGDRQSNGLIVLRASETQGYSLVVGDDGCIEAIGMDDVIQQKYGGVNFEKVIDATGKCVLPGLIDGHTHPVWVGDRVQEFSMKLEGATYMDIHKAGGGIYFTVDHVHRATEEELYQSLIKRLRAMVRCGTTTVEAKTGYGLDGPNEMKMLRVLERARQQFHDVDISTTYCAAHAVPKGKTADEATDDIVNSQLPQLKEMISNGEVRVDNIDVFYETGIFERENAARILAAGGELGMNVNFHGDELNSNRSGELGASVGARAISHLEEIDEEGVVSMCDHDITAVLLPTTAYILKLKPPPARLMIEKGVAVALGSDFNPNAFCYSMPAVMHMACCLLRMSMNEALIGATINAANSLGLARTCGSLEKRKHADLLVVDAPRWEHLIYRFACHDDIIDYVIKKGRVVHGK